MMNNEQLSNLANAAYGAAVSATDPRDVAFAAGVEALARHLLDRGTARDLAILLGDVVRADDVRARFTAAAR